MHYKCAAGLHERCEVGETFQISLLRAVDVEMVGVGRGHHGNPRAQMVERAVEFIGLDYAPWRFWSEQEITVVVA